MSYASAILLFLFICILVFFLLPGNASRYARSAVLILLTHPYERDAGAEAKGVVLVAGDSTGYGVGVFDNRKSVAGRIGEDFPEYTVRNISVNGATMREMTDILMQHTEKEPYDVLLLQVGANDVLQQRSSAEMEADLQALIVEAEKHARAVVHLSSGNVGAAKAFVRNGVPDAALEKRTREARDVFIKVAQERGTHYVDLFVEPEEDVFLSNPRKYLAWDGLHPNENGYALWYEKLLPVIKELQRSL